MNTSAHQTLTVKDLSVDQHEAYAGIKTWLDRGVQLKQTLSLGGFAGSGKSTVVSVLAHELLQRGPVAFCSFTGKASSVLSRKLKAAGIDTVSRIPGRKALAAMGGFNPKPYCGTIHGLIYAPCDVCMVEESYDHNYGKKCTAPGATGADGAEESPKVEFEAAENAWRASQTEEVCLACNPPPPVKREGPCYKCHGERFFRRSGLDRGYSLIVNDEASMTGDDMLRDLLSYRVPLLAVGDHGQLPPVKGTGSLMRSPDLRLEKIHRQAEGNPIIALSAYVREHGETSEDFMDGKHVSFMAKRDFQKWIAAKFPAERLGFDPAASEGILGTVLISWTNKQRVALNDQVREALGISGESPKKGEAMICLKNAAPVYNGMRGVLEYDAESTGSEQYPQWKTTVNFVEDGVKEENVKMAEAQLFAEKTIDYDTAQEMGLSLSRLGRQYDFGYAMTCHKMQGSQAPEVAVLIEGMKSMTRDDRTRWIYTAVTRSADRLVCVMS
jgi:UvrD-like helicase C-terminal domain/AAA domain